MEKEDKRLAAAVAALRGLERGDLEELLKAMIRPPPDVIVKYGDEERVISRKVLQLCSMRFLFMNFTVMFDIKPLPGESMKQEKEKVQGTFSKRRQLRYVPLTLYARFIHGPAADGHYREVPCWDGSWARIVPNIERILIKREGDPCPEGALSADGTPIREKGEEILGSSESEGSSESGSGSSSPKDEKDESESVKVSVEEQLPQLKYVEPSRFIFPSR